MLDEDRKHIQNFTYRLKVDLTRPTPYCTSCSSMWEVDARVAELGWCEWANIFSPWSLKSREKGAGLCWGGTWPLPALDGGLGLCPLSQLALLWEELQLACRAPLDGSRGGAAAAVGIRTVIRSQIREKGQHSPQSNPHVPFKCWGPLSWFDTSKTLKRSRPRVHSKCNHTHSKAHLSYLGTTLQL